MAYRVLFGMVALLFAAPAGAASQPIALWVDGGGARHDELTAALGKALGATPATPAARPSDEAALHALRSELHVARLVIVRVDQQGRDRFTLEAQSVDAVGVAHRYADASADTLVQRTVDLVAQLPPVPAEETKPAPPPAAEPTPETPPVTGTVAAPAAPPPTEPASPPVYRRRHPYDMLIAGAVTFLLPYFTTVGFAANYQSYNANAARVGYIPLAGPFLARERISDKDLSDGYNPGLLVDGIVQVLTFNLLIAGIVWCAVGEKHVVDNPRRAHVQPLFGVAAGQARLGAMVTW